jgi:hypothetical protein
VAVIVTGSSTSGVTPFAARVKAIAVGTYSVGITVGRLELAGKAQLVSKPMNMKKDHFRRVACMNDYLPRISLTNY